MRNCVRDLFADLYHGAGAFVWCLLYVTLGGIIGAALAGIVAGIVASLFVLGEIAGRYLLTH